MGNEQAFNSSGTRYCLCFYSCPTAVAQGSGSWKSEHQNWRQKKVRNTIVCLFLIVPHEHAIVGRRMDGWRVGGGTAAGPLKLDS